MKSASNGYLSILGNRLFVSSANNGQVSICIYNSSGRIVKKFRTVQKTLDLSKGLKAGAYLVQADQCGSTISQRMIINN